jgi:precorrin-6Y C5,15-methyltransferase (decarboxylating)
MLCAEGGGLSAAKPFGIPDTSFALLNSRTKMITKMPIRLLTLQALDLQRRKVLWDIGACTGSVSIEARLLFPHLHVAAFEVRPECESIILENARRHGAPGIELHIGDFCSVSFSTGQTAKPDDGQGPAIPPPDAVFIGGHGGRLKDIMARVYGVLAPGGVIVMNSVTSAVVEQATSGRPPSRQLWDEACASLGLRQDPPLRIQLNDYNPIEILKAHKQKQ